MLLMDAGLTYDTTSCYASLGYSDLKAGAPVVLKDEKGTILASGVLGKGTPPTGRGTCSFPFNLTGVPDTAKFYTVTVSNRGEISESHDELAGKGWAFALTIGS
jgi:hypothetical protein